MSITDRPALEWAPDPKNPNRIRAVSSDWSYTILTDTDGQGHLTIRLPKGIPRPTAGDPRYTSVYKAHAYVSLPAAKRAAQRWENDRTHTDGYEHWRDPERRWPTTGRRPASRSVR